MCGNAKYYLVPTYICDKGKKSLDYICYIIQCKLGIKSFEEKDKK